MGVAPTLPARRAAHNCTLESTREIVGRIELGAIRFERRSSPAQGAV
jgi:hypothetical protein